MSKNFSLKDPSTLNTAFKVFNENPPILGSQFEIFYNGWPQAKWVAQGLTVPGLKTNTVEINFSGFHIPVIINTMYDETELSMDIIADENGVYYDQWRQMVINYSSDPFKGRPILSGSTANTTVGTVKWGQYYIVAKLWNPIIKKTTGHCWRFHNFKPTSIGEIELSHGSTDFTTFTVTGVFTHISYTNEVDDALLGVAKSGVPVPKRIPQNIQALAQPEQSPLTLSEAAGGAVMAMPDPSGIVAGAFGDGTSMDYAVASAASAISQMEPGKAYTFTTKTVTGGVLTTTTGLLTPGANNDAALVNASARVAAARAKALRSK